MTRIILSFCHVCLILQNMRSLFLVLLFALFPLRMMLAQNDGPPIAITSPDKGTTFAFGTIKTHSLIWRNNMLIARITFTDQDVTTQEASNDVLEFRLPGVTYDSAKGIFYAQSVDGETIPVAHIKKTLFIKSIDTLPNAHVRVIHPRGVVAVVLEAISPTDPSMHPAASAAPSDGMHQVNIDVHNILN